MLKRYCLIGVKGIGKTTLIDAIRNRVTNVEFIIGSEILRKIVGTEFQNFDAFPEEKKEFFRKEGIKEFKKIQKKTGKDILVDGHVILYNPIIDKIEIVFTKDDSELYSDIILYETSAETVFDRRSKDTKKKRILDIDIIKEEINEEKKNALLISNEYNIVFHTINGNNFNLAQEQLIKILSGNV